MAGRKRNEIKSIVAQNGYVVKKEHLEKTILDQIRRDLKAEPKVSFAFQDFAKSFPVYWENERYIGLPRQYAMKLLGPPDVNRLPQGEDIDVKFKGTLRPIQKKAFDVMTDACEREGGGILSLPCGFGKCFQKGTLLRLQSGGLVEVQNLEPGDRLLGDDSTCRVVQSVSMGYGRLYKVRAGNLAPIVVNGVHILCCWHREKRRMTEITVDAFLKLPKQSQNQYYGVRNTAHFRTRSNVSPKDVYEIGYAMATKVEEEGNLDPAGTVVSYSVEERMSYLNGYLDGLMAKGKAKGNVKWYRSENSYLCMFQLLASLCIDFADGRSNDGRYWIRFPEKISSRESQISDKPIQVDYLKHGWHYGLVISGNGRFLHWDGTVVHNTVTAIALASALKKKTLIVVHKEFLMRQWIESLEQFTDAEVGIIRQSKVQADDKDFVVGMLQSLASRAYPPDIIGSFGTVIIDECHHMAAPSFSKAFFRASCRNVIGLSATVKRPDGLSHVFFKHIGDVKFQVDRKLDSAVQVVQYSARFPKTQLRFTYTGHINYVRMITDLVKSDYRNTFIRDLILGLENERNILVLSERRQHLERLNELVKEINVDEKTGFYVGGLKQTVLDETKDQARIIFATYQMAEEGFDCKKLDTLVMATPKKRVEQTVGRILRKTVSERVRHPLILDIIDDLSNFKALSFQRLRFYKKMEYKIRSINLDLKNYSPQITGQNFVLEPVSPQRSVKSCVMTLE